MLLGISRRFSYANIMATMALVFAMTGGAYAAKRYLITSTRQIRPSVLKHLTGKQGPQGKQGLEGKQGLQGAAGKDGAPGGPGEKGAPGESVSSMSIASTSNKCGKLGGAEFKVGSGAPVYACNGAPWTAGGTLPTGASESGQWGWRQLDYKQGQQAYVPISFTIPLKTAPVPHFIGLEEGEGEAHQANAITNGECKGTVANPGATSGNLCVFTTEMTKSEQSASPPLAEVKMGGFVNGQGSGEAGETGALIALSDSSGEVGFAIARGVWVVVG